MNVLIRDQLLFFLWSVVLGVGLAVTYDILRIIRRVVPHNKVIIGFEDALFWLIASIIMFDYVFKTNSGIVRGFFFVGVCIGVISYLKLLSHTLTDGLSKFINFILNKLFLLGKILIKPIYILVKPLYFFGEKLFQGLKKRQKYLIMKIEDILKEIGCVIRKI